MAKILKSKSASASGGMDALVKVLRDKSYRVIAPVRTGEFSLFKEIESADEICLDFVNTRRSVKEYFLPCHEKILNLKFTKDKVEVEDVTDFAPKTVIIGVRSCDAASLPIMDSVFSWDYKDKFFLERREATTVINIVCKEADESCFCSSLGLAPDSKEGADIQFIPQADGSYMVEAVTEKGENLLADMGDGIFSDGEGDRSQVVEIERKFELEKVKPWLDDNFDDPFWKEVAMPCIGCGVCAFVCPNCHCFDIVDEADLEEGARVKNWDSCGFQLFTLHTSGHNPRETQDARWRQRVMHKFKYYVEKFDQTSCVGCGRCIRSCPVNIDILSQLMTIANHEQ